MPRFYMKICTVLPARFGNSKRIHLSGLFSCLWKEFKNSSFVKKPRLSRILSYSLWSLLLERLTSILSANLFLSPFQKILLKWVNNSMCYYFTIKHKKFKLITKFTKSVMIIFPTKIHTVQSMLFGLQ